MSRKFYHTVYKITEFHRTKVANISTESTSKIIGMLPKKSKK